MRIAGFCLIAGLGVEAISLLWNDPLAFVLFLVLGGLFTGAGVLIYLGDLILGPRAAK